MRGLVEGVGDADQLRLAPFAAKETHADRQAMNETRRYGDVGIAGHGCG